MADIPTHNLNKRKTQTLKTEEAIFLSLPKTKPILALSLLIVVLSALNMLPVIPGLDTFARDILGMPSLTLRHFSVELFYPVMFFLMMFLVMLQNGRRQQVALQKYRFGLILDIAFVTSALVLALAYLIEQPAICLMDQVTGARAAMIARTLQSEQELALLLGLPMPEVVLNPECVGTFGPWLMGVISMCCIVIILYMGWIWGWPMVAVAAVVLAYTVATIAVWYFFGAEDINKYFVTKMGNAPQRLLDTHPKFVDVLINSSNGLFGRFLDVILNIVFPYIVLGALFASSGAGESLMKVALRSTRRFRGGPALAAVVGSGLFGTMSGGSVINVMSTGPLTIPLMLRRGYTPAFAGGIEAAASAGGAIMPPVMGVAAFVLASFAAVSYGQVLIAAIIPAVAYFLCLFLTVSIQARKQGIEPLGEITPEMRFTKQDQLHLAMILLPLTVLMFFLMFPKDFITCQALNALPFQSLWTCEGGQLPWLLQLIQNSVGDAGSAGWWASAILVLMFLLNRGKTEVGVINALGKSAVLMSLLYGLFFVLSVVDFCLQLTGVPTYLTIDLLAFFDGVSLKEQEQLGLRLMVLVATMSAVLVLGMGMPALPAYINVAVLMSPILSDLGMALLTAHMFIFYFATASSITPPVALAAFAAASITKADSMQTSWVAVRAGMVLFLVPFAFALHPELLLIDAAVQYRTPEGTLAFLPGHEAGITFGYVALLVMRLILAIYLLATAFSRFEVRPLNVLQIVLRCLAAAFLMWPIENLVPWYGLALAIACLLQTRFGHFGKAA